MHGDLCGDSQQQCRLTTHSPQANKQMTRTRRAGREIYLLPNIATFSSCIGHVRVKDQAR